MSEPFDIVIVGGGMVGASLACALAGGPETEGFRTLLIEGFPLLRDDAPPRYQPSFDARSTALSLSSARIFEELGLWGAIAAHAQAISRIHVSDRGRYGSTVLDACEESLPALGYVVENHWLGTVLHGGLRACRGLEVLAPARVTGLRPAADGALLSVEHAGERSEVRARLAVIADGARSGLAAGIGIGIDARLRTGCRDCERCAPGGASRPRVRAFHRRRAAGDAAVARRTAGPGAQRTGLGAGAAGSRAARRAR